MSKIIYITGGARSGKSTFAEKLMMSFDPDVVYVATSIAYDEEMEDRIKKHRQQRPSRWQTLEGYKDMKSLLQQASSNARALLLDCLTIMVSNLMLEEDLDWDVLTPSQTDKLEEKVTNEIKSLLAALRQMDIYAVLVSNELGMGVVPAYKLGRIFRDIAGRINQMVAKEADEAYLLVSGIPIKIK